jgi:hypothetical protein
MLTRHRVKERELRLEILLNNRVSVSNLLLLLLLSTTPTKLTNFSGTFVWDLGLRREVSTEHNLFQNYEEKNAWFASKKPSGDHCIAMIDRTRPA